MLNREKVTLLSRTLISLSAVGLITLSGGCSKKAEANAPAPAATNQTQADGAPIGPPEMPAPQVQPGTPPPTVSDPAELNRELRKWILRNRRTPKDFNDFASTAGIQVPPPPEGKRYAIDKTMHVVLVKR
jgi:hypothetical protein